MSKLKKLAAGVLAVALCVTSIMAPAPKNAEAATYCSHTIYNAGREIVGCIPMGDHSHTISVPYARFSGNDGRMTFLCNVYVLTAKDVYRCYKCNYHYYGGTTYYSELQHSIN